MINDSNAPTILVVEDDPDMRALIVRALESEDYVVEPVAGGDEALTKLQSGMRPSLVLVDVQMPDMSGDEFVTKLRLYEGSDALKVLLLSGMNDLAKRAKELGVAGYIRKPVDLRTLLREVKRFL